MKKLIYLFLALIIVVCSDDSGGNDNNDNNNNTNCEFILNTLPVTNAVNNNATFNGIISIDGNCEFPITEQGFVYSTAIQPTLNNNQVNVNGTDVTTTINNLEPNTTYYIRTFLTNVLGEFYGNELSFLSNNAVYLADNGVTIKGYEWAEAGDTGVINGITYTVVNESILREMIENGDDVTKVCTSLIADMSNLCESNTSFNQNISSWDVSNVTNMDGIFYGSSFNQDISSWDVSSVTTMESMFFDSSFNQPIGNWDVSSVTTMQYMFDSAESFNQPIGNWDVSNVTDMSGMFNYAYSFNQPIGNWDVSNVTDMSGMFSNIRNPGGSTAFNQPLGNWDVSNVTDMGFMFNYAYSYNQNLSSWNVNNVTYCYHFRHYVVGWTLPKPNFTNCTP